MTTPQIFNPGLAQDDSAQQAKTTGRGKEDKEYPTTGNISRDGVRKLIFEAFAGDEQVQGARYSVSQIVDLLENQENKDPKSKQYRDKSRAVQNKLRGPRFQQTRKDLITGALESRQMVFDDVAVGKGNASDLPKQGSQPPLGNPVGAPAFRPGMPNMGGPMARPRFPGGPPGYRPPMGGIGRPPVPMQMTQPQFQQQRSEERSVEENKEVKSQPQNYESPVPSSKRSIEQLNITQQSSSNRMQHAESEVIQQESVLRVTQTDSQSEPTHQNSALQFSDSPRQQYEQVQETELTKPQTESYLQMDEQNTAAQMFGADQFNTSQTQAVIEDTSLSKSKKGGKKKKKKGKKGQKAQEESYQQEDEFESSHHHQFQDSGAKEQQQEVVEEHKDEDQKPPSRKESEDFRYPTGSPVINQQPEQRLVMTPYNAFDDTHKHQDEQPPLLNQQQSQEVPIEVPSAISPRQINIQEEEEAVKIQEIIEEPPLQIVEDEKEVSNIRQSSEREAEQEHSRSPLKMRDEIEEEKGETQLRHKNIVKSFGQDQLQQIQSIASLSNQNLDNENTKRLNEAVKFKREQNKELKEKLILMENDQQLQQKKAILAMEENKSLREELRKAQKELQTRRANEEMIHKQSQAQIAKLEQALREKTREIDHLMRESEKFRAEKDSYKDRLNQQIQHSQSQRDQLDKLIKVLQGRSSYLLNVQSSQSHEYAASNQQEQIENVQKEMNEQKQHYESLLRQKNQELQTRMKDLQRVERQNVSLQNKVRSLTDSVNNLQVQVLSTVAGSGSNQRDAQAILNQRRNTNENEEEGYHHVGEEEGTGGFNHQHRQHQDYGYGEEGAVAVGEMEEEEGFAGDSMGRGRNANQAEAVGGQNIDQEEEDQDYEENEDEEDEDEDYGEGGDLDDEGTEARGLYSQQQQQQFSTNLQEESEGGFREERKQGQRQHRRRGNRQQNQQHSSVGSSNAQNPARQRNSRGRQQRSNQQHTGAMNQADQTAPSTVQQNRQQQYSEYFQSYGDSSSMHQFNIPHSQQPSMGGVAGAGAVHMAGRGQFGTNAAISSSENMMNAESGSTAFVDKRTGGNMQSRVVGGTSPYHGYVQTGQNNNQAMQMNEQLPPESSSEVDIFGAAVGPPTMRTAAAHPRTRQINQQNMVNNYQQYQEETKQSSGEQPFFYGNAQTNTSHQRQNYFIGGSGEAEDESSMNYNSSGLGTGANIIYPQSNAFERRTQQSLQGRMVENSHTPRRNDSRKTSGANTPNKDGADTPTTQSYRGQQHQNLYVHNLTSNQLFFSNQDENEGGGQFTQQHQPSSVEVIPTNMFE